MAKRLGYWTLLGKDCWKAGYILVGSFIVAFLINHFRSDGIPLVAREPYQIFVPCPETEAEAAKVSLDQVATRGGVTFPKGAVLVDARSPERFAEGHVDGAVSVPYDELEGVADEDVARLEALGRERQFIVYCDGWEEEEDPQLRYSHPPSEHLADELKSRGLEKASSLEGGLKAFLDQGGTLVTEVPHGE